MEKEQNQTEVKNATDEKKKNTEVTQHKGFARERAPKAEGCGQRGLAVLS
mgnify:CR=1 FL=1